jgi:hypothetical protein
MATLDELSRALIAADKAGDAAAAKILAGEITRMRQSAAPKADPKEFAFDPMRDMSSGQRFAAGAGKAVADVGRGLGQMVGLVDRKDVAESRKLDAPLMDTTGGMVGSIAGNVAMLAPTAFVPGAATLPGAALIGGATGLAAPSTSTKETIQNTAIGAAAAPAAILAGRGVAAAYQGVRGLIQPFTQRGQQEIAASALRASATNPTAAANNLRNARPLVQGSQPTVAQAAQDPGLAQLERTVLNNPEMAGALQQRYAAQRGARMNTLRGVMGTDDHYDAIQQGRRVFANEDYANAIAQGADPQMAQAMAPQIESLMRRPSIQRAQAVARDLAAENDISLTNFNSVEGLDWLKKALDNQISRAGQPGSAIGEAELRALNQTKRDLMSVLEQVSPAYRTANNNYAAMSRQVNSMDVARHLHDKLQKPGSEYAGGSAREMGDAYMRALSESVDSTKKATGMDRALSDLLPTNDIAALEAVAMDLGRKSFAENAGRATGSPTAQNMISQNLLRRIIGPTGLPQSWAENTMLQTMMRPAQFVGRIAEPRVQNRLAELMLNPEQAALALQMQQALPLTSRIGAGAQPYLPQIGLNPLLAATSNRPQ